ncbi:hypothetical protein DFH11DRAFT_1604941 [Phellopilus nigrolimitatus]|nr:hypothetical protein DFH11DRAFT_1604941 [Phellopilus nigrolimitatus]
MSSVTSGCVRTLQRYLSHLSSARDCPESGLMSTTHEENAETRRKARLGGRHKATDPTLVVVSVHRARRHPRPRPTLISRYLPFLHPSFSFFLSKRPQWTHLYLRRIQTRTICPPRCRFCRSTASVRPTPSMSSSSTTTFSTAYTPPSTRSTLPGLPRPRLRPLRDPYHPSVLRSHARPPPSPHHSPRSAAPPPSRRSQTKRMTALRRATHISSRAALRTTSARPTRSSVAARLARLALLAPAAQLTSAVKMGLTMSAPA